MDDKTEYRTELNIENGTNGIIKSDDHVFYAVDNVIGATARANDFGGLTFYYSSNNPSSFTSNKTKAHEFGHLLGLLHNNENLFNGKSLNGLSGKEINSMLKQFNLEKNLMDYGENDMNVHKQQFQKIESNFIEGKLNKGDNSFDKEHGRESKTSNVGYEINYK